MESDFLSKISIKFDLEAKLEAHSLDDPCWVVAHKPWLNKIQPVIERLSTCFKSNNYES